MLKFFLPETRGHANRFYLLIPIRSEYVDAYVTIQQGEIGPRGGRSKLDITGYLLQEIEDDAENPEFSGRAFLIARDDVDKAEIYNVYIPPAPGIGFCTCDGWRFSGSCKHYHLCSHLVRIVGWRTDGLSWGNDYEPPVVDFDQQQLPF